MKSAWLRAALLAIVGLGGIYWFALRRGMIAPAQTWFEWGGPITCPADGAWHTPPATSLAGDRSLTQLLPPNFEPSKTSILIEKGKHRLTLYYQQQPVKSYPVVFGDPKGDKRREGDRKTPEGILRIQDKYPHPSWSRFLWLDYPNAQSWCKHRRAKQRGEIPFFSSIGGEVGIHGVPTGQDFLVEGRSNWTLGCPSLRTKDVEELADVVQVGTIVEIIP